MIMKMVLAAGIVLAAVLTPVPAVAAPAAVLSTYLMNVTVAPGGEDAEVSLHGILRGAGARRVAYRIDYSAVAAFAKLVPDDEPSDDISVQETSESPDAGPCTGAGPVLTCTTVVEARGFVVPMGDFLVRATAAAQPGDAGTVVVTARVDGGPISTSESRVRIGEPVDLATRGTTRLPVRPGGTAFYRPEVSNVGSTAVDGVVLYFAVEPAWLAGTSFTNCTYGDAVVCTFDTTLAPGTRYRLAQPVPLRVPRDAAAGSSLTGTPEWLTPAAWADWQDSFPGARIGRPGTRTPLELVPVVTAAGAPQADVDRGNQQAAFELTVTGATRPDVAAVGARVAGRAGDRIPLKVGLVNRGPGTLHPRLFDNNAIGVTVVVPGGLTVVRADARCTRWFVQDGEAGYGCWMRPDPVRAGGSALFAFTVAVSDRYDGTAGRVEADVDESLENGRGAGNNTAKLLVRLPDGAGLPITGTGMGLTAAALLTVGTAGLLLARRRRLRFRA